jgi:hypothetical protein
VKYEWIIVGGGIAGIALSEILTRQGHCALLLEQEGKLAGGATKDFHEWIHTGCLYTLLPDKLRTLKYVLGAIDDLLEYYSSFRRMNLVPTECGLEIVGEGWFVPNPIHFKYRLRRFNPVWSFIQARSEYLIGHIAQHDWLRRRAGVLEEFKVNQYRSIYRNLRRLIRHRGDFYTLKTTDFTTHSRRLLRDLIATSLRYGLDIALNQVVQEIKDRHGIKTVITDHGVFKADKVVLCTGDHIAKFVDVEIKSSYAPMAVVTGLDETAYSFVELDYYTRNCINLLIKGQGIGLIGGISLNRRSECEDYIEYVIRRHKGYQPGLKVIDKYIGVKNEIIFPAQDRNYLFHIVGCGPNMWAAIPGKFILGFSLAPEFYRRVYRRNPRKAFQTITDIDQATDLVAETRWQEMARLYLREDLRLPAESRKMSPLGCRR